MMQTLNIQGASGETLIYTFDSVILPLSYTAKMQCRDKPSGSLINEFDIVEVSGEFTVTSQNVFNLGIYLYDLRVLNLSNNQATTYYKGVIEII